MKKAVFRLGETRCLIAMSSCPHLRVGLTTDISYHLFLNPYLKKMVGKIRRSGYPELLRLSIVFHLISIVCFLCFLWPINLLIIFY